MPDPFERFTERWQVLVGVPEKWRRFLDDGRDLARSVFWEALVAQHDPHTTGRAADEVAQILADFATAKANAASLRRAEERAAKWATEHAPGLTVDEAYWLDTGSNSSFDEPDRPLRSVDDQRPAQLVLWLKAAAGPSRAVTIDRPPLSQRPHPAEPSDDKEVLAGLASIESVSWSPELDDGVRQVLHAGRPFFELSRFKDRWLIRWRNADGMRLSISYKAPAAVVQWAREAREVILPAEPLAGRRPV